MPKKWTPETRRVVGARPPLPVRSVKSAGRVLQILEYFDEIQRPATVIEISKMLALPQSSTSALLQTLVDTGYLYSDRAAHSYWPSCKVALLGNWVAKPLFSGGTLLQCMEEINLKTGDAVVLAMRNGIWAQYIHVLQATNIARMRMTLGTLRPVAASGFGYALLSTLPESEVLRIVHRNNAEARAGQVKAVNSSELLKTLEEVRRVGYSFTVGLFTPGGSVLATPLPATDQGNPLVIGVAGIGEVQKKRKLELAKVVHQAVHAHLVPG